MRHDLDAQHEAERREAKAQTDEEERARQAKLAADNETTAVGAFPEASKKIAEAIKTAQSKESQGKFEGSEDALSAAQYHIDKFKGTSVEQSKEFTDLANQVEERRNAIQPHLDRIHEKYRAEKQREEQASRAAPAARENTRGECNDETPDARFNVNVCFADCTQGRAAACGILGVLFDYGNKGLPKDPARSRSFSQRACQLGDSAACARLE